MCEYCYIFTHYLYEMKKIAYLISVIFLLLLLYMYYSHRSYTYYVDNFSEGIFNEDTLIRGGDYKMILSLALINDISRNTFYTGNLDKIKNDIIKAYPNLDTNHFKRAFIKPYDTNYQEYIYIVSCGMDRMKSFTGEIGIPDSVCFLEYSLNIKDIILAREYYGFGSSLRWGPKLFINDNKIIDSVNYLSHLKNLLAHERFLRFPKGFNYRAFYSLGFPKRGVFISYHMKDNTWKILWEYKGESEKSIQIEKPDIEQFINILKKDSLFQYVDSIHFPFYIP